LGPGSFNNPKKPLAYKQVFFPINFGGFGFISTTTIALVAYLGSWAFVASIIVSRFMVDQRPFLFEALTQVNNNNFLFQQHFKVACDLLPPPIRSYPLLFKQLINQQMVQFQDSISECLHHHTLSNMFFDGIFEAHHA
jgi:hypothetical protein